MVALTIGMATYDDFDGVYFTIQALRMYQDMDDVELLVIDNFGCEHTKTFLEGLPNVRYVLANDVIGTAAAKNLVFVHARGDAVVCCDSHVLFWPHAIARLKAYYRDHPETRNLLQGPLVYDDLGNISTHFDPVWRGEMWGIWATDPRGTDPDGPPFDIPMQGMGVFSCRTATWPGFHPAFRGFGGEEGYIHEKVRQGGARTLCLPWLRWVHRFGRPKGVPYPLTIEHKLRNYIIGHTELGLDIAPALEHFADHLPAETVAAVKEEALRDLAALAEAPVGHTRNGDKKRKKHAVKNRGGKLAKGVRRELERVLVQALTDEVSTAFRTLSPAAEFEDAGSPSSASATARDTLVGSGLLTHDDFRTLAVDEAVDRALGNASNLSMLAAVFGLHAFGANGTRRGLPAAGTAAQDDGLDVPLEMRAG